MSNKLFNNISSTFLVVGTDTGVGKTVFSGLLGRYILNSDYNSILLKPFCSGGIGDIQFLRYVNLNFSEINYWYCEAAISPATWELRSKNKIDFEGCLNFISNSVQNDNYVEAKKTAILVEGVGGLLAPLTKCKTVASFGQAIGAKLFLVAPNRVGVVNQVLLTLEAAFSRGFSVACVVLMQQETPDESAIDNAELIRMHLPKKSKFNLIFEFPWLGGRADDPSFIGLNVKKAEGVLGTIFEKCVLPSLVRDSCVN